MILKITRGAQVGLTRGFVPRPKSARRLVHAGGVHEEGRCRDLRLNPGDLRAMARSPPASSGGQGFGTHSSGSGAGLPPVGSAGGAASDAMSASQTPPVKRFLNLI